MPRVSLSTAALLLATSACGRYWVCDLADPDRTAELPTRLSDTGLYADIATGQLAPGVVGYTPQFPLWSDGADKQRWIWLPPGAQIDSSDMDDWVFPAGTKMWKQFSAGGVRIETRLIEKRGSGDEDWIPLSYVWDTDERDASAAPLGVLDARRSGHDVPAAGECAACHGGRRSFVLGFSAIQLASRASVGQLDLAALVEQGRLTTPPASAPIVPGNPIEVAALGYLHANCGHCHNQRRPARGGPRCFDPENGYDFTLSLADLASTSSTGTYRTAVGSAVKPGDPDDSAAFTRMNRRGFLRQMPPLATTKIDADGVAAVRAWIEALP